jgi:hypothetical protein
MIQVCANSNLFAQPSQIIGARQMQCDAETSFAI